MAWLRQLPDEPRAQDLLLVHASPGDLWRAPQPDAENAELGSRTDHETRPSPSTATSTAQIIRELAGLTVANSGSIGSPFDGDPRASYVVLDSGRAQVVRVAYDIDRERDRLRRSGYPDTARIAETRRKGKYIAVAPPA
jgi:hypothetical protein